MGEAFHVLEGAVRLDDSADVFLVDIVPRLALPEAALLRCVYEQHLATPLGGFGLVQYADSNGDAGPGEEGWAPVR